MESIASVMILLGRSSPTWATAPGGRCMGVNACVDTDGPRVGPDLIPKGSMQPDSV